jgi:hypothetical protein
VITIIKKNESGETVFTYPGNVVRETQRGILVEAIFGIREVQVEDVTLIEGDLFHELYLYSKWFNLYEVHIGKTDEIKAWYCNICRPVRYENNCIEYEDLALDLLVYPDGRYSILDRVAFRALPISGHERRLALQGLEELIGLFHAAPNIDLMDLLT